MEALHRDRDARRIASIRPAGRPGRPATTRARRRSDRWRTLALLCGLVLSSGAGKSLAAPQTPSDCHAIADPTGRLLCYDRVTERPQPLPPAVPTAPTDSATTATPATPQPDSAVTPAAPTDDPPRSTRGLAQPAPVATVPDEPATIVKLERTNIGRHRFELANGEIWEQLEPGSITVRKGDLVNVRQTTFGAWVLREVDNSSRSVRVRRLE